LKNLAKVVTFHGLVELSGSQTTTMGNLLRAGMKDSLRMADREAIKAHKAHRHRTTQTQSQAESAD
jgi:hypothetical protein